MIKKQKFDEIYYEYKDTVYRYVFVRTGDPETTYEIGQEVFAKYYENMMEIQDDMVAPWLLLCAKHKIVDYWRKQRRFKETSYEACVLERELISDNGLEKIVESAAQREFILRLLSELKAKNEGWYEVVEAVCIFEMPQDEAAQYLGISVPVLRARLSRARKFLRKNHGKDYHRGL